MDGPLNSLRQRIGFIPILLAFLWLHISNLAEESKPPLSLHDVLQSVTNQYPPYLAALIERDIASGRYRSALGAMDLQTYMKVFDNPTGFYESTTAEAGFEQFTPLRGATLFGGYQYTDGFLPDYYRNRRTDGGGTPMLGLRLPLLRDGSIDSRRAIIYKADLDRKLADPLIFKQHLDFTQAAMKAYYYWLATGLKYETTDSLLKIAKDRASAIQSQIERGLIAPIAQLENQQIVVSRELSAVKARRQLEAATVILSLFYRDANDAPILPSRSRIPKLFPPPRDLPPDTLSKTLTHASITRPEVRIYELELEKLNVDTRLFRNQLQPRLDAFAEASQSIGERLYKDTGEFELKLGIEFKMPLQRNKAKGKLQENAAKIEQWQQKTRFAMDRIATEVWDAHSAVNAAWEQVAQAKQNVDLANQLQEVEKDRFALGATDFLALQIREQTAFKARLTEVEVLQAYYSALANLITSAGIDCRTAATEGKPHPVEWLSTVPPVR